MRFELLSSSAGAPPILDGVCTILCGDTSAELYRGLLERGWILPQSSFMGLGSAVFWGSWLMVAIINLWHCLCFRIRVTEHHITYVGTFGVSQIPVAGLSLRWRSFPGWGSVHLCRGLGRIKIDFGMLEFAEREPLAIWLNQTVPPDAQTNWKEFQTKVVNTEWPKRQSIYDFL